jgi:phosphatidylinositol dimannoside acyltransferase
MDKDGVRIARRPARASGLSERVTARLYLLAWVLVCRLPRSWMYWLFMRIADVLWRRQGKSVLRLEANLRRVIGEAAPPEQLRQLSRAGMRSYLRYWLEVFRLPVIPPAEIMARMRMDGDQTEIALGHLAAGRGVIFALPHMGNYEQAGAWIVRRGAGSFTTVAERLSSTAVYDKFLAFRESLGMEVLPHTGGGGPFERLAERLRQGRLVCLVCDRDLSKHGIEVQFFGEAAKIAAGPAALAVDTGAALMPVTLWFQGEDWGARIYPEIPVPQAGARKDKVAAMSQDLARVFERGISEHPEDWHMLQKLFVADLDRRRLPKVGVDGSAEVTESTPAAS